MQISDRIYGEIEVKEPVIIELIKSQPLERLKKINQDGAPHFIHPIRTVTRFEHSIGAWYLSNRFHRPIEEQIASLLHDVPHTAFSHVTDFVMHDEKHEYHDRFTKKIILESEIPSILKKHNIDIQKVLHKEAYYLLDNDLPDISVDRWDYFMRDGHTSRLISQQTIDLFLSEMKEKNERFYFTDIRIASEFAILFMNFSRLLWLDPTSHGSFFLIAEAMKEGLREKIITTDDFFETDEYMMKKLRKLKNKKIQGYLNRLKPGKEFVYASKLDAEFYGPNKPRSVDPWVLKDGELVKTSDLVAGLKYYMEQFKEQYKNIGVKQMD